MKGYFKVSLTVLVLVLAALIANNRPSQPTRAAGPWYVAPPPLGNDSNDCLSPPTACATINGAIGKATSGDTILIATGVYTGTGDQVVLLNKSATLSGGWNAGFAVQDGTSTINAERVRRGIKVNNGVTASVDRFTILGGSAVWGGVGQNGGGIYNDGTLVVNNSSLLTNHTSFLGSGIFNTGILTLSHSTASNNSTPTPGANSTIENRGTMTVYSSTISSNVGCGIENDQATMSIDNTSVSNNTSCGIMNLANSILILNNSTVSGNAYHGLINGANATLNSSTVSGNKALDDGGGIYNSDSIYNPGTLIMKNTIIAGNTTEGNGPDCYGSPSSGGYNLIGNTSGCGFSPGTGDLVNVNAHLGSLIGIPGTAGYNPLLPGSPAIDAGNPSGCMGSTGPLITDQRGAARVGRCDIGAYEYITPSTPVGIYAFSGSSQRAGPLQAFARPLQALVLDGIGSPVSHVTITFSAPSSGASATFASTSTYTQTATTNDSGIATSAALIANDVKGGYTVTAQTNGVTTTADFVLANFAWYVSPGGSDSNDCQSPTTTCASINGALNKSGFMSQDTVLVAAGIYTGTGDQVVSLDKSVIASGGWNNAFTMQNGTTIVDGERARRGVVVLYDYTTAIIEYFTLQNGSGSGIANYGTLTLNHSTVRNSIAEVGGGGLYSQGTATLNNSAVSGNTTTATSGMGGGGIYNTHKLTMNNSTISGNTTAARGGGILSYGTLSLNNSTVSGNSASSEGGGVYVGGGNSVMRNTIIAQNTASAGADCSGINLGSVGNNLIGILSGCIVTPTVGDLININARLFPLIGSPGYHPLLPGSPAINAGNPTGCTDDHGNPLNTDQRGVARVGYCDIGAYEYDPDHDPLKYIFLPIVLRQ